MLTFSQNGVKINGFAEYGSNELLDLEWGVDDLIDIECQWFQRVSAYIFSLETYGYDLSSLS